MTEPLPEFWSFNRWRDSTLIQVEDILWQGPFSWPGFAHINTLPPIPDLGGVYLFTFTYQDGYILRSAGHTTSMKRRFAQHKREYMAGRYTVLDVTAAKRGERKEIWHGWGYARAHPDQFLRHKEEILKAVAAELAAYHLFVAEVADRRKRERMEYAIIQSAYLSKEPWGDLVDHQMALSGRSNREIPIEAHNQCSHKLYGLAQTLEI